MMKRRMKLAGHVACLGKKWSVYRVSVGEPEGKAPVG
jgi:hypothetical protein